MPVYSPRVSDETRVRLDIYYAGVSLHGHRIADDTRVRLGVCYAGMGLYEHRIVDDTHAVLSALAVQLLVHAPIVEFDEFDIIDVGEAWNMFTEEELRQLVMQGQKVKVGEVSKENVSVSELIALEQYLAKRDANPFRLLRVADVIVKDRQDRQTR